MPHWFNRLRGFRLNLARLRGLRPSRGDRDLGPAGHAQRWTMPRQPTDRQEPPIMPAGEECKQRTPLSLVSRGEGRAHVGDAIQRAFGRHDISSVQAHVGAQAAAAAHAMGADAYAVGDHVVAGDATDLFTMAHEAAHVIQQRSGVQCKGSVSEAHDRHERHADEVAARVAEGRSAESLLDAYAGARSDGGELATPADDVGRGSHVVQRHHTSQHGAGEHTGKGHPAPQVNAEPASPRKRKAKAPGKEKQRGEDTPPDTASDEQGDAKSETKHLRKKKKAKKKKRREHVRSAEWSKERDARKRSEARGSNESTQTPPALRAEGWGTDTTTPWRGIALEQLSTMYGEEEAEEAEEAGWGASAPQRRKTWALQPEPQREKPDDGEEAEEYEIVERGADYDEEEEEEEEEGEKTGQGARSASSKRVVYDTNPFENKHVSVGHGDLAADLSEAYTRARGRAQAAEYENSIPASTVMVLSTAQLQGFQRGVQERFGPYRFSYAVRVEGEKVQLFQDGSFTVATSLKSRSCIDHFVATEFQNGTEISLTSDPSTHSHSFFDGKDQVTFFVTTNQAKRTVFNE